MSYRNTFPDDDPPHYCPHGVDREYDECWQCEEQTDYDSPFYRPGNERYPDGAYDVVSGPDEDERMGAALAARERTR